MPRLRLAFGRLFSETNAFSPVPTTREDFARLHLLEGADVERVARPWQPELAGLTPLAELSGFWLATASPAVERVPLLSAFALPSGPIEERCWRELADGLLERLAAARPVDGVYLALHGSLRGAGPTKEPEEVLLREVREVVGPDVPIAISLDMHAQLTPAKVAGADLIVGYRTNPHRDLPWVGREAGRLLRLAATKRIRPTSAWRSLPLALGGGKTIDFLAPMRSLLARFRAAERRPGVLRANLFTVHPFSDSPDLGWSVHVTTDGDRNLAEALADELAEAAWGVRDVPPPPFVPPEEALAEARAARLARRTGCVFFSDVSDVVGAGAAGENTHLPRALLEHAGELRCYAPIRDADAVDALHGRPPGTEATLQLGGRLDPAMNPPLQVHGRLRASADLGAAGRAIAIDLGALQLVVTEGPPYTLRPSFYTDLGLEIGDADVIVVKSFFHFMLAFAPWVRKVVPVKTRGATDLDACAALSFREAVHPFQRVDDWRPADRRRRGLEAPAAYAG